MKAVVGLLLLAVMLLAVPVSAGQQVVVVLANYLSLDDLLSAGPNVRSLAKDGAVGLMNTGYRIKFPDIRYLTLGTGIRAGGVNGMAACYGAGELVNGTPAGEVYRIQTGKVAPRGSIVCLGFARILRANQKPPFTKDAVGLLGDAFHRAGLKTCVIGNRDADEKNRRAGFIAMDRNGLVDSEEMSSQSDGLIVIEPPDFNRLEDTRELMSQPAYDLQKSRSLRKLDSLVGSIRSSLKGTLIVCSPSRISPEKGFKPNLTPIILFQSHGKQGLLTSGTTRTDGLISNMDVAPTILSQADLPVLDFVTGRPAEVIASADPIEHLRRMERVVTQEYKIRIPVLAAIGVLAILAATLMEITSGKGRGARRAFRLVFLFLLCLPASLLITDGFGIIGIGRYLVGLVMVTVGLMALSQAGSALSGRRISPLPIVLGMTALLVLGDIVTGAHLLQRSMLTCNQICGMRYYGLGNEYMGVLVTSALLFPLLVWKPKGMTIPVLIWFAVVTLAIGYPGFGADFGGFLTGVAAFGVAWIALSGMRFRMRHALVLIILAALVGGLLFLMDTGSRVSHFGRSVSLARIYGWQWLGYLIGGKLVMHIGILKTPQVRYTLLGSIPFFMLYGRRMKSEVAQESVVRTVGTPALVVGMIAAFLFNDSGIVPAGLMLGIYMVSMLYLRLQEAS